MDLLQILENEWTERNNRDRSEEESEDEESEEEIGKYVILTVSQLFWVYDDYRIAFTISFPVGTAKEMYDYLKSKMDFAMCRKIDSREFWDLDDLLRFESATEFSYRFSDEEQEFYQGTEYS